MMSRTAHVVRNTSESQVDVSIDLDGTGESTISTGVGFYDHMLTALSKHSGIDMRIRTTGDLEIDGHHSIEDTAIALGQAIGEALGDKAGITRFGDATVPLDEALAQCVVDVAGRPYVVCSGEPESQVTVRIGGAGVAYQGSMTYH
ncbi:MAG: imidazoleglycerol-phosphate dehydratase, partial [Acidipropionibacterium jensenii]|nr:imidazoleglycerol-phosphate dehydratase [Acidipropionibacterium jensenii]